MAILKSVVNVNNGNTGWTRQNVLDALETTFANLGWNGGTPIAGSPVNMIGPGGTTTGNIQGGNWLATGGTPPPYIQSITRRFYVTSNGTSSYNFQEYYFLYNYDTANDYLYVYRHGFETGSPVIYTAFPGSSSAITGLTTDTTYYIIKYGDDAFKLATTAENASNIIAINITAVTGSWNTVAFFKKPYSALFNNYQIDLLQGDGLVFEGEVLRDTDTNMRLIANNGTTYAANAVINSANISYSYGEYPTGYGGAAIIWTARGFPQTEDEPVYSNAVEVEYTGTINYAYVSTVYPDMKGIINILPSLTNNNYSVNVYPYWKYTVPASGGRSSLKLRVSRIPSTYSNSRAVSSISINSIGSGWSNNEVFTIPGNQIGGTSPANDIVFGVNSYTSAQITAKNAVSSVLVTNYGAGSTMYQKSSSGHFAVLKNVNDASKTYGTTYYGFGVSTDNLFLNITSGPAWSALNRNGTAITVANSTTEFGSFAGIVGKDYQQSYNYIPQSNDGSWSRVAICSTSTPTAYPLSIRTYKAQSPQDTNFAIIQFTQTINNVIVPYGTFSIQKGPLFGAGVYDLNYVWNGGTSYYDITSRTILQYYRQPGYNYYYSSSATNSEPLTNNTLTREASYGYLRNGSGYSENATMVSYYACNIDTRNSSTSEIVTYYRNSTYDGIASQANYYKPMKGIPVSNNLMPCPYYLPDDYVMLQVSTTPGLTQFRPGDTITVSVSEVYEIILAAYEVNANGLDNISSNSSIGMLFCARTT